MLFIIIWIKTQVKSYFLKIDYKVGILLLNKCNKNSIMSIETMRLAKSSLLGISKRVWDKSLKLLRSVQHQMFDAVVYWKSLSLATQVIAAILINCAEVGQQNRNHHFMTIYRFLSHSHRTDLKTGRMKLTVKTAFSQLCQSWKSGFTVLFFILKIGQ